MCSSSSSGMVATCVMIMSGSGAGNPSGVEAFAAFPFSQLPHESTQLAPGFVYRTTSELNTLTGDIHAQDHWVLEGGHYETGRETADRAGSVAELGLPEDLRGQAAG